MKRQSSLPVYVTIFTHGHELWVVTEKDKGETLGHLGEVKVEALSLGQEEAAEAARATLWDTRTRPEEDSRYVGGSICLSGPGSTSKSSQRSSRKCLG